MGLESDVVIPKMIAPIPAEFQSSESHEIETKIDPPPTAQVVRIVLQQRTPDGYLRRTWAGGPPNGKNMGDVLRIQASQNGKPLRLDLNYNKVIWSGLSWGVAEIRSFSPAEPLLVRCSSSEKDPVKLEARIYRVTY